MHAILSQNHRGKNDKIISKEIFYERRNNIGLLSGITIDKIDIGGIFSGFGTLLKDVRTAITGKAPLDPTKLAELEAKTLEIEQILMSAQTDINKIEAASPRLFVSGWRPAVGWICVVALGTHYFVFPITSWILPIIGYPEINLPAMELGDLYPLLFGMLGFGALRSYDKMKGTENK
jgi:hypothetical protein